MTPYSEQAHTARVQAAKFYAAFDRYADQGKDLAATRALREGRKLDALAVQYEALAAKHGEV